MLKRLHRIFIVALHIYKQTDHAGIVKRLMGKQSNKIEKRKRRLAYLKRRRAAAKGKKKSAVQSVSP